MLVHEIFHRILHEGELNGDPVLGKVQFNAVLDHSLFSSFLDTHGPELIAMLAIKAF